MSYCYLNGKFINEGDAKVSVFDLGFMRGYGVFDLAYAKEGKIFRLQDHIDRLFNSAKVLDIPIKLTKNEIIDATKQLLIKNSLPESNVRWIATYGEEGSKESTFIILNQEFHFFDKKYYEEGIKLTTVDKKREMPEAKSLNYQILYSMHRKMKQNNIFEILYAPGGRVLECSTSNIFMVKNGKIYTSAKEILLGITRKVVIEIANKTGLGIIEKDLTTSQLKNADEVFITATNKKILPVNEIDGQSFSEPGIITRKLMQGFEQYEKLSLA